VPTDALTFPSGGDHDGGKAKMIGSGHK
jgi:hypothetical protein